MASTAIVFRSQTKRHRGDFCVRWSGQLTGVLSAADNGASLNSATAIFNDLFFTDFELNQFRDFDFGFFRSEWFGNRKHRNRANQRGQQASDDPCLQVFIFGVQLVAGSLYWCWNGTSAVTDNSIMVITCAGEENTTNMQVPAKATLSSKFQTPVSIWGSRHLC